MLGNKGLKFSKRQSNAGKSTFYIWYMEPTNIEFVGFFVKIMFEDGNVFP